MNFETSGKAQLDTSSTVRDKRHGTDDFACKTQRDLQDSQLSPAKAAQTFANELSERDSKALFNFRQARQMSNVWHISDLASQGSQLNREYNAILSGQRTYTSQGLTSIDDKQSPEYIIRQYIIKNPIDPQRFEDQRKAVIDSSTDITQTTDFPRESQILFNNLNTSQSEIFKILLQWQLLPTDNVSNCMKKDFASKIIQELNNGNGLPIEAIHATITPKALRPDTCLSHCFPLTLTDLEDSPSATAVHSHKA